jgi:hypothetical protein
VATELRQNIVLPRSRQLRTWPFQIDSVRVGLLPLSTLTLASSTKRIIVNTQSSSSCLFIFLRLTFLWVILALDLLYCYVALLHIFLNVVRLEALKSLMQQKRPTSPAECLLDMILFGSGAHDHICCRSKVRVGPFLLVFRKWQKLLSIIQPCEHMFISDFKLGRSSVVTWSWYFPFSLQD